MAKEIKIPQIAEGTDVATVSEILVSEGDTIEKDQALIAVESDKASVEIPSPEAGTVKSIKVSAGDEVNVGDVILTLEASDDEQEEQGKEGAEESKKNEESKSEGKEKDTAAKENTEEESEEDSGKKEKKKKDETNAGEEQDDVEEKGKKESGETETSKNEEKEDAEKSKDKQGEKKQKTETENGNESSKASVAAAPSVRRLARELGVDITAVKASGEGGRLNEQDIKAFAKAEKTSSSAIKSPALPDFNKWGATENQPLSGIRKATAKNVTAAWTSIPHVFQFDEADISDIQEYMQKLSEKAEKTGGKITITAILVKIAAFALRQFPKFNASIDMENEQMILKKYVNIGIAVDTEKGLLVPVIRNVDQKSILDLAAEITKLAQKGRDQKLTAEEMQGACFTISNLGGIGGTNFTPIIPSHQAAILGISRSTTKPVYTAGQFEPREILPLSLSYDHRLIDGAEGIRFLHWIKEALEDPYKALLGA